MIRSGSRSGRTRRGRCDVDTDAHRNMRRFLEENLRGRTRWKRRRLQTTRTPLPQARPGTHSSLARYLAKSASLAARSSGFQGTSGNLSRRSSSSCDSAVYPTGSFWSARTSCQGRRETRRLGLLWCRATRRVLSPAVRHRKWTSKRPASGAHLGQHHPGQHQALFAWHVSPPELQAPAALPCRVLLPVQSSLLAHRDVSPPRIRRPAHCADALPGAQTGGELSVIKMSLVRNQDNFSNTFCTNSRDTR